MHCETVECCNPHVHVYAMESDGEPKLFALCSSCATEYAAEFLQHQNPSWFMGYTNQEEGRCRYRLWQDYQRAYTTFEQLYHADRVCTSKSCSKLDERVTQYLFSSGSELSLCRTCAVSSQRVMRDRGTLISREYYEQVYNPLAHKAFEPR